MKLRGIVSSDLAKSLEFDMEVRTLSPSERTNMAVKKALLFFVLALVSVPIIALHFVLVPTFLGLSIYSFFAIIKKNFSVAGGHFVCPGCQAKIEGPKSSFNWPLKTTCPQCQLQLRIEPSNSSV